MSVVLTAEEIQRREPVWIALSDLFLDTDVSLFDERISRALRDSKFGADEVEHILREEVGPVLYLNLLDVAGEWACFPSERVKSEVAKYLSLPTPLRIAQRALSSAVVEGVIRTDWPRVRHATWGAH